MWIVGQIAGKEGVAVPWSIGAPLAMILPMDGCSLRVIDLRCRLKC